MSALVAGSMAPDLPLFTLGRSWYGITHSWTGAVTVDPAIALVTLGIWFFWVRDAVVDLSPSYVRCRLAPRARLTARQWLAAPVAAALGSLTHVTWDAFTHSGRWGVELVPWLQDQHGRLAGYSWAQYASSVLGMLVVAAALLVALHHQPVVRERVPGRMHASAALLVVAAPAVVLGARAVLHYRGMGRQVMAFHGVVEGLAGAAIGLFLVTLLWHVGRLRRVPSDDPEA